MDNIKMVLGERGWDGMGWMDCVVSQMTVLKKDLAPRMSE
jgi:hypothetical protein